MKSIFSYIFFPFLPLALCLSACTDEASPSSLAGDEDEGSGVFVSVVVNTGGDASTRVPTGGENGDGLQPVEGDENKVYDLNVFFFQGDNGINSTGNPGIDCQLYFSSAELRASDDDTYYSDAKEVTDNGLLIGETYCVLVIANAGSRLTGANTLDALRDYRIAQPVSADYTRFLMASASDAGPITIEPRTRNNPVKVSVRVERMAARVDCCWNDSYEVPEDNDLPSFGGSSSTEADKVKILGASLVNRYRGETWAFKRVTNSLTDFSDITYLGDETVNNRVASNYVLDPLTLTVSGKSNSDYNYYYTEYVNWNVDTDFQNPFNNFNNNEVTSTDDDENTYIRWAYTRENVNQAPVQDAPVQDATNWRELYATGIMFQAQYTPAGFTAGKTFYVYPNNNKRTIYTAEELRKEHGDVFGDLPEANWGDVDGCEVYDQGRCYYVYWIRHADDSNAAAISPMEYAIVRNNIYQLKINSISGLGTPEPDSNVKEVEFDIHVRVKLWTEVKVEVPPFD